MLRFFDEERREECSRERVWRNFSITTEGMLWCLTRNGLFDSSDQLWNPSQQQTSVLLLCRSLRPCILIENLRFLNLLDQMTKELFWERGIWGNFAAESSTSPFLRNFRVSFEIGEGKSGLNVFLSLPHQRPYATYDVFSPHGTTLTELSLLTTG